MTGIYCIVNNVNGKQYVGQAANIKARWTQHRQALRNGTHYNAHLQSAWDKYSESAFSFCILEECPIESLNDREQYYISALDTFQNGYNMTKGGEGTRGCTHTEQYKKMMRELFKGRKFSEQTIEKMRAAKKGITPPETESRRKGRKIVSEKLKGRHFSEEHKRRLSESHKGRDVWNKGMKMPEGYNHPMLGKHLSEETRSKLSAACKGKKQTREVALKSAKQVFCIETGEVFESITDAAKKYGVTISAISRVLRGKAKTSAKLHWEYLRK